MNRTRYIVRSGGLAIALLFIVSACAPAAAPQSTSAPAATSASAATSAPAATTAAQPTATVAGTPLPGSSAGKIVYWGGLIFSDVANKMLVDRINQWGKEKNVPVEVVMINQNETTQRVSAAVEAGNLPDALDMGTDLMLLLSQKGQLEVLDDLYTKIGSAHGGWIKSADDSTDPKLFGGHRYGIPFGTSGNLLNRRDDLLKAKGFNDPPKTWEELSKMATAVNNPPKVYGMGFAVSNVGDGNLMTSILQSWGGRIADDAGKTCTIDSQPTRDFMKWVTDAYKAGLFPPGATTWDGAGDNNAYQSGTAAFIANPGSVFLYLKKNDPELATASKYSALPAGPKTRVAPQSPNVRAIPTTSKNKDLAKDLLAYLADDTFMEQYYTNAIYGPVLTSQKSFKVFSDDPVHQGLLDLALNGTGPTYPDINNAAFAEYQTNFLTPKMIQRVVVDNKSIDDAIKETQAACQAIYDKYK